MYLQHCILLLRSVKHQRCGARAISRLPVLALEVTPDLFLPPADLEIVVKSQILT